MTKYLELSERGLQPTLDGCVECSAVGVERGRVLGGAGRPPSGQGLAHAHESIREALLQPLSVARRVYLCDLLRQLLALSEGQRDREDIVIYTYMSACIHVFK